MFLISSLPNPLKPGVQLRMKMYLEQCWQAMFQLHLSDHQFYCLLKCEVRGLMVRFFIHNLHNSFHAGDVAVILKISNFQLYIKDKYLELDIYSSPRWMPPNPIDYQSTLVKAIAWCRQATSHYLSQCWPISMLPYGITRPQWINSTVSTMT